ncbi:MAG TPA: iron-sulfur cluster assembly protein [Saprospiraceae bacterium]|nr:iron-sulfur cluster assembly protein [Saprospiraceae bacterium]HQW57278.1 iron-sulfur cluster assembly protein [Saprospiraceae bacterium]
MEAKVVQEDIEAALKEVYDPELPVNIFDLGLIYKIEITSESIVNINMTLTAPACPASNEIMFDVQTKVSAVPGVQDVNINLTFDPPWNREMLSEEAMFELGWM